MADAQYPNTHSVLDGVGDFAGSKTRTGLSTQIVVYVGTEPVGAIQSFQETQARTNKRISEVGTDGVIEIVPQAPGQVTLTVQRVVFDGLSLPQAFSRGFKNIHAQRIPFDIMVIDKFTGTGESNSGAIVTTYHNCWFSNLSKTYQVSDYTIIENANIDCEFVSSERDGQPVASTTAGGQRDIRAPDVDAIEQLADQGHSGRRGALDFPGLISAAF